MKKSEIKELREVKISSESYKIPEGWSLVKEPTKMVENGNDFFKIVIGKD